MMKGHFFDKTRSNHRDVNLNDIFHNMHLMDNWDKDKENNNNNNNKVSKKSAYNIFEPSVQETKTYIQKGYAAQNDLQDLDSTACHALTKRIEEELRAAKSAQLACGEVLLPDDLLPRIATDVLRMSENEPCGLRGCTLYINFEAEQECRRIGTVKCDPTTVSTFELFLTLKQGSRNSWHNMLPTFLKNFTRGGTVIISRLFTLEKRKLYRSLLPSST